MELENLIPASHTDPQRHGLRCQETCSPATENFLRQARELSARADRVKVVGEATSMFYDLAEAEGRAEILRLGLTAFDDMRAEFKKIPAPRPNQRTVLPVPEDSDLNSQRGQLLEAANLLSLKAKTFNIDLKRLTGLVGHTMDRLYPTGEFGIDPTSPDTQALVQSAMANRPDLQLLRLAYFEVSEESLPESREQLKHKLGFLVSIPAVTGEEERKVADDVRKAVVAQETAAAFVASARTRAEDLRKKYEDAKAAKGANPMTLFTSQFEWYKARGEVIQAVMMWHKARVALMAAQGLLE
jgi:outer membrane protein TolC